MQQINCCSSLLVFMFGGSDSLYSFLIVPPPVALLKTGRIFPMNWVIRLRFRSENPFNPGSSLFRSRPGAVEYLLPTLQPAADPR